MAGKSDIIECVADRADLSKKQATDAFVAVFECITDVLADGDRVQVPGFGSFSISHREARTGRNPATGAAMHIAASNNVKFKAGKDLKETVNR